MSAVFVPFLDCEYFEDRAVHYSVWIVLDEQQNLPHRVFDDVFFLGLAHATRTTTFKVGMSCQHNPRVLLASASLTL